MTTFAPSTAHSIDATGASHGETPSKSRRRTPRLTTTKVLILILGATIGLGWIGRLAMFTSLEPFDDEGDWLIELRQFGEHGSLYHLTWSQCGPFYYDFWTALFRVTRQPVDTDTGRIAGLLTWMTICAGVAVLAWLVTHRLSLTFLAEIAVFFVMEPLSGEPMEPAGLATLLLVATLLCAIVLRKYNSRLASFLIGLLLTATLLTKVNIGAFLIAGLVCAALLTESRYRSRWQLPATGIFVCVPLLVCSTILGDGWVQSYVELVCLSGFAFVVGGGGGRQVSVATMPRLPLYRSDLTSGLAGAVALTVLVTATALGSGTSISQLVHGSLLSQRDLAKIYVGPINIQRTALLFGLLSIALALATTRTSLTRNMTPGLRVAWRMVLGSFILITGVGGLVTSSRTLSIGPSALLSALFQSRLPMSGPMAIGSFQYAVPFVWAILRRPTQGTSPVSMPTRSIVGSVAILLTLEGFPVAGHQVSWSVVGLLVVAVIILSDAVAIAKASRSAFFRCLPRGVIAGLLCLMLLCNLSYFRSDYGSLYAQGTAPALRGARLVHWPQQTVSDFEAVTRVLSKRCSSFYGLPGLNSFYLFTGETPPTGLLTTQWMYLMSIPTQDRIIDALRLTSRMCVLYYEPALSFWEEGKPLPKNSPLLSYIERGFSPAIDIDGYTILVSAAKGAPMPLERSPYLPQFRGSRVRTSAPTSVPDYS